MAANTTKTISLGSPLTPIKMCTFHDLPIDIICEGCDKFICSECAKTDHKSHNWKTITTAANERRRGLQEFLRKIKEGDLYKIDKKLEKMSQRITENKKQCYSEIKKLKMHVDEIMARLTEIKKRNEKTIQDNLVKKNDQVNHEISELKKKKKRIVDTVEFMEENNSNMSDYSVIDNHRELTKMLSEFEVHVTNCAHSMRFTKGEINIDFLKSFVGETLEDMDNISVAHINTFRHGDKNILSLKKFCEDQCYIHELNSKYIAEVNPKCTKKYKFRIFPIDMCVANNNNVYFTEFSNNEINCLSPLGSVSTVSSTDHMEPVGICQSVDGGLLVTLIDKESDLFKLEPHSRRLVRYITVTGDVIHEYEYQEDGHTRLFTLPYRVTQNRNSDICVVNRTSDAKGELVIISPSGRLRSVYRGQNLTEYFTPTDVVCDSLCNILVTDTNNKQIHLLTPNGVFLKFLLTENEVNHPSSLSLYKSTLWVGYVEGLVKVFQYIM
ncbi:uncharacterized protein LOC134272324 [Saccostrea cucullata]|uniref:uncharacterized protein LOC134272324 n=1 Tax=Saccostrea cuccullata TaxID=36930 RepID=UPI002ED52E32